MVLIGTTLVLTMLFGFLPACGGGGGAGGGATTGAAGGGAATGAPVAAGEVYNWRFQANALAGTPTYWTEQEYCVVLKAASAGRLNLDIQPQGAIVGSLEIFDAVATGAIESGEC